MKKNNKEINGNLELEISERTDQLIEQGMDPDLAVSKAENEKAIEILKTLNPFW